MTPKKFFIILAIVCGMVIIGNILSRYIKKFVPIGSSTTERTIIKGGVLHEQ